ncbi:arginyl-tRNA synthetase [Stygiomarasmius scandens]|uniref:Arginyl-tRNA synthetase n=1 Tax=Marasmiellus scandens TaxID=2682957 RepID=A0ABR1JX10_9AGAR
MSALPSVLRSQPAIQDASTTPAVLQAAQSLAKVTSPEETALFICALQNCYRLFPTRDRLMLHRKRDHDTEHDEHIITWNE